MKITQKHRDAAKLLAEGKLTQKEIAEKVGVHVRSIGWWQNDPDFQKELEKEERRATGLGLTILKRWSPEAAKKLIMLLKSKNDETARKAANDILEAAGLKSQKVKDNVFETLTIK